MVGLILVLIVAVPIAFMWAKGIDKMHTEHPDYKGGDFLNWDDDTFHTEDKI